MIECFLVNDMIYDTYQGAELGLAFETIYKNCLNQLEALYSYILLFNTSNVVLLYFL